MSQLKKLHELEKQAEQIRSKLKYSKKGEAIYQASQSMWSDNQIVVEADGVGGAKLLIIEGNYPLDYAVHRQQSFSSEDQACEAADALVK